MLFVLFRRKRFPVLSAVPIILAILRIFADGKEDQQVPRRAGPLEEIASASAGSISGIHDDFGLVLMGHGGIVGGPDLRTASFNAN